MRPVSPFHLPYPDVRALRIALAAGAVAGLVVIAACTDKGDKSITAPAAAAAGPRSETIEPGGFALAGTATVCIAGSAPAGQYYITNSAYKLPNGGTGGLSGTSAENFPDGTAYPAGPVGFHPGDCTTVVTRTAPVDNFCDDAVPPGTGPGCGFPAGPPFDASHKTNVDAYTGVVVTITGMPPGVTYNHTQCIIDFGVRNPRDADRSGANAAPQYGAINWPPSSVSPPPHPCDTNNNPSTIFANIAHGMKLTFFFNAPTGPCPLLNPIFLGFTVLSGATLEDPGSITGNIHSNDRINFSGGAKVFGDASAVHGFTGSATITGTATPFGPPVVLPTLAQVLAAIPPDLTINGNLTITSANAATYQGKTVYVKGSVNLGNVTLTATIIAAGGVDMSSSTHLTAHAGGLAVYGGSHVNASGVISGAVVSPDVNIATAARIVCQ